MNRSSLAILIGAALLAALMMGAAAVFGEPIQWTYPPEVYSVEMESASYDKRNKLWQIANGEAHMHHAQIHADLKDIMAEHTQAINEMAQSIQSLAQSLAESIESTGTTAAAVNRLSRSVEDNMWHKLNPKAANLPAVIDINTDNWHALAGIHGLGIGMSQAIVAKGNSAPFGSVDDLLLVPGMTQALLDHIRPFVEVRP